jgi:hypothetical protein
METTYHSFGQIGIPFGVEFKKYTAVYMAQDAFTRQYHTVTPEVFINLASGTWLKDPVMSISYTGNIGVIDTPVQTVIHIHDTGSTTPDEYASFDSLVLRELRRLMGLPV